jgi:hypothetical protein
MTDRISYQWDVETVDEHGDIQDHEHGELANLLALFGSDILTGTASQRLVLIRNKWNDIDGVTDRQFAYIKSGVLPDEFEGGAKIPAAYMKKVLVIQNES